MSDRIIGRGMRFPLRPSSTGGFLHIEGEDLVAQSIKLILSTAVGERQMRFEHGSELPRMIFEPITGETLGAIEESARIALRDYEPRIRVLALRAEPHSRVASQVDLSIDYEILRTSRRANLVYPLYLSQG